MPHFRETASTTDCNTTCLSDQGILYFFGKISIGQQAGEKSNWRIPVPIANLPIIKQVSCGYAFTYCIDENECVWGFGSNDSGQLGIDRDTITNITQPQIIPGLPLAQSISGGSNHGLFICDSNLWSIGSNDMAQLCLGHTKHAILTQTNFSNISKISASFNRSLFQNDKGEIYGCGSNEYGQLGLGHKKSPQIEVCFIPNQPANIIDFCGLYHSLFLDMDGNVYAVGYGIRGSIGNGRCQNIFQIEQIKNIPLIKAINSCRDSCYLIDDDDNVWSFGNNMHSQLGHGKKTKFIHTPKKIPNLSGIQAISGGGYGYHVLLKDYNGRIFGFGDNNYGQLGISKENPMVPELMEEQYFSIWDASLGMRNKSKSARK